MPASRYDSPMPYVYKHRRPPEPWHQFRRKATHPALLPFYVLEFGSEWAAYLLSKWSLLEVLDYAGTFSILLAVIFYFAETGDRTQARHNQAWQVINTAQGKGGSGGRIEALQALNKDGVALVGVDVSDAFLQGVELDSANLLRADVRRADMRGARLSGANLELGNLHFTNLRDADLRRTNLRDANLQDADLNGASLIAADLTGAVLDRADLRNADLRGVAGWEQTSADHADITGVRNAPTGFVAWALQHGAIDQARTPTTQPTSKP